MKGFQKISLFVSLSLIIFILLFHVNFSRAEDTASINPNLGLDFVILLEGQSATIGTSQEIPFDMHMVGVISIGNSSLSAEIQNLPGDASGFACLGLVSTGAKAICDFAFGLIPNNGISVSTGIDDNISYGLVTSTLLLFSEASPETPVKYKYKLKIGQ